MSIVYGSHGQILNQTVSSGPLSSANIIYFTLPWSNSSYIRDIKLISPTGITPGSGVSIYLSFNNAHTLMGEIGVVGIAFTNHYYYAAENQSLTTGSKNIFVNINNGVYAEDIYNRNYLYAKVVCPAGVSVPLKLQVSGQKIYQDSYSKTDNNGLSYLQDYSVILGRNQSGGTGGTLIDVTSFAKSTGTAVNSGNFEIRSANDYIYVGSTKKITIWDFKIANPSITIGLLQGQIWDGTAWRGFRVMDNTQSVSTNTLRYSGIVEGVGLATSTWVPTKLDNVKNNALSDDPATILERAINAGNHIPINMFTNPERYWARFSVASITQKVGLAGLYPVVSPY